MGGKLIGGNAAGTIGAGDPAGPAALPEGGDLWSGLKAWTAHPFTGRMDYRSGCRYAPALGGRSGCLRAERLALQWREWAGRNPRLAKRGGRSPAEAEFEALPLFCQSCIVAAQSPRASRARERARRKGERAKQGRRGLLARLFPHRIRGPTPPPRRIIERELEPDPPDRPAPAPPEAAETCVPPAPSGPALPSPGESTVHCGKCGREVPAARWKGHQAWHKGLENKTAGKGKRRKATKGAGASPRHGDGGAVASGAGPGPGALPSAGSGSRRGGGSKRKGAGGVKPSGKRRSG